MPKYYRLFASCIPVKGSKRSLICDVQRNNFEFIPNTLYDILTEDKERSLEDIKGLYGSKNENIIDEYFDFLVKNEFAFYCNKEELDLFPEMNLYWNEPANITNAIIDIDEGSQHDFERIFNELEELGCKHIQIRCYSTKTLSFYEDIMDSLENTIIISVEFITKYSADYSVEQLRVLVNSYPRVQSFILHSTSKEKVVQYNEQCDKKIFFTHQTIDSQSHCGIISPQYFSVNIKTFTEAQKHNTCLNRKIGIDTNGDIKNCPSMTKTYGNITNTNLKEAINKVGFQEAWTIHKDQIKVCQDCEFRYICTDCRAFLENQYDKPQKCNYDPYTAKWT